MRKRGGLGKENTLYLVRKLMFQKYTNLLLLEKVINKLLQVTYLKEFRFGGEARTRLTSKLIFYFNGWVYAVAILTALYP